MNQQGWIWIATSSDGGRSWSEFTKTTLPNPDSGIDTVDLGNGEILLLHNCSHDTRYPLTISRSIDGGESWKPLCNIETTLGEFPYAIRTSDGLVHISYAYAAPGRDQRRIKHVVLDPHIL